MGKTLVAYFSATGITAKVANTMAGAMGADLFEIKPCTPYTQADLNWQDPNSRSSVEMKDPTSRPAVDGILTEMADYDRIFLGFPIWWYVAPTIVNSFLECYNLSGKTVIPFATSGGSDFGDTNQRLQPSCPKSKLLPGKVFPADISGTQLSVWVNSLGL